jgi:hypothetical protein
VNTNTLSFQRNAALIVLSAFICVVTPALAKRLAPNPVKPVVRDGIEYSAPLNREGFVVATWIKTGREIWCRQVYTIKHEYKQGLEEDVQTCFITDLRFEKGKLKVTNEQNSQFEVDPTTLAVTLLKGQLVIDYTGFKL